MMKTVKGLLRAITPYGLLELRRKMIDRPRQIPPNSARALFHEERRHRIASALTSTEDSGGSLHGEDYESVVNFIVHRGVSHVHAVEGSISKDSLAFIQKHVCENLPRSGHPVALHIGNFLGVSLVYIAGFLTRLDEESLVIAIDPNLPHRGVSNPQDHVAALVCACGLQKNIIILAGYSGRKNVSNDGVVFESYDPGDEFGREYACEETLRNLRKIVSAKFDVVIMDGNHEADYLVCEIKSALHVMKPGSLLVLDDVNDAWDEIRDVFLTIDSLGLIPLASDGRVGIAQVKC